LVDEGPAVGEWTLVLEGTFVGEGASVVAVNSIDEGASLVVVDVGGVEVGARAPTAVYGAAVVVDGAGVAEALSGVDRTLVVDQTTGVEGDNITGVGVVCGDGTSGVVVDRTLVVDGSSIRGCDAAPVVEECAVVVVQDAWVHRAIDDDTIAVYDTIVVHPASNKSYRTSAVDCSLIVDGGRVDVDDAVVSNDYTGRNRECCSVDSPRFPCINGHVISDRRI